MGIRGNNFITVDKKNKKRLSHLIFESQPVVLLGSGISKWAPTNLPTGEQFAGALFSVLFKTGLLSKEDSEDALLANIYNDLPFEVINEMSLEPQNLKSFLQKIYFVEKPNPIHRLFAKLLLEQEISSLVTTNYDNSLEKAISNARHSLSNNESQIASIVTKEDFGLFDPISEIPYFKIHGSAASGEAETMVFQLKQESVLETWKQNLLRRMLGGKILFIVGYSGRDFDICSQIALAKPKRIVWNQYRATNETLHPNPKLVAKQVETHFAIGDMRELLEIVQGLDDVREGLGNPNLENELKSNFNDRRTALWAIRTLNSMTYSRLSLAGIENYVKMGNNEPNTKSRLLGEQASALANSGKYKQAALAHEAAANLGGLDEQQKLSHLLGASDAWRCTGNFIKAIRDHTKVTSRFRKKPSLRNVLIAHVYRNEILLLRHAYQVLKLFRLHLFAAKIQNRAKGLIISSTKYFWKTGNWYPLQQSALWIKKFDLSDDIGMYGKEIEIPAPLEGYKQLSFLMGQMMAFREILEAGTGLVNQRWKFSRGNLLKKLN